MLPSNLTHSTSVLIATVLAAVLGPLRTQSLASGPDAPPASTEALRPAAAPASSAASAPRPELPPLPEGVTELAFREIFAPAGPRGLEFTAKAKALEGKRVRILGFMVKTCRHDHGRFLLTPMPLALHDHEMGPADDLPPCTVFVEVPPLRRALKFVPHEPGLFLLTGTLTLGGRDELHGRRSWVRLELERPGQVEAPATNGTPATAAVRQQVRVLDTAPAAVPPPTPSERAAPTKRSQDRDLNQQDGTTKQDQ